MRRIIVLTRLLLNNVGSSNKSASTAMIISFVVLGLFVGIPFIGGSFAISLGAFMLFNQPEQITALYSTITSSIGIVMIFFSIFTIPALYYFSKDIPLLLPLPFRSWEIVLAKFLTALVYEYIIVGVIFIPMNIAYVIAVGFSFSWFITFLLAAITLPIIPVAYGSIAVIILMRFAPFFGNKERFNLIAGVFALLFAVGINVFSQSFTSIDTTTILSDISQLQIPLVANIFFIYSNWIALSAGGAIQYLVLYVVYVAALVALFLFLASKLYFKSVLTVTDTQSKKQELSGAQMKKKTQSSSVFIAYVKKEIRAITRSSVYLLNLPLSSFVLPLVMLIPLFGGDQFGELVGFVKELDFTSPVALNVIIIIGAMSGILLGGINNISITSVVREGSGFFITKMLPIAYETQLLAKAIPGIIVGVIAEVMLILIFTIFFQLPFIAIILLCLYSFLGIVFINMADIFIGSIKPKLDWSTEAEAVKQSMLALAGIFISIGVMLLFAIFFVLTFIPVYVMIIVIAIILCGASYGFWKLAVKAFTKFANNY